MRRQEHYTKTLKVRPPDSWGAELPYVPRENKSNIIFLQLVCIMFSSGRQVWGHMLTVVFAPDGYCSCLGAQVPRILPWTLR